MASRPADPLDPAEALREAQYIADRTISVAAGQGYISDEERQEVLAAIDRLARTAWEDGRQTNLPEDARPDWLPKSEEPR